MKDKDIEFCLATIKESLEYLKDLQDIYEDIFWDNPPGEANEKQVSANKTNLEVIENITHIERVSRMIEDERE